MRRILKVSMIVATLCGAVAAPSIFAQAPIFVLPSLDAAPAPSQPATTPQPARAMVSPASSAIPTRNALPTTNALPTRSATQLSELPIAHSTNNALPEAPSPANTRRHTPEVTSEIGTCRKRYSDAVYNIGLALWTAPPAQHRALERLLNAAAAAQAVAMDPNTTQQGFCADATLNDLEATVVRLKAKGWVPMTETEQHATRTNDVGDELKHAIAGISR